jgi:hypothetical protein
VWSNGKVKTVLSVSVFLFLLAIIGIFYLRGLSIQEGEDLPDVHPARTESTPEGLILDPAVCAQASTPDPTDDGILSPPILSIGGGSVRSADFTFGLWLYCDPSFGVHPLEPDYFSDIAGLGIWFTWRYDSPAIEGVAETYWGVEPEIQKRGEYIGDLTSGTSIEGFTGVILPSNLKAKSQLDNDQLNFVLKVSIPRGEIFGSSLSFMIQSHTEGLRPVEIQTIGFEDISPGGLAVATLKPPSSTYVPPAPEGGPPPADFDPSNSPLDIRIHMGDDLNNPSFFYGDIYAMDYLLGRVDLGYSPVRWCDRSEDGSRLAFVYFTPPETGESHKLRWFDLRDVTEVFDPLPDLEIKSGISWSPLGYQLAFFACAAEEKCGLYLLDADKNEYQLITDDVMGYHLLLWKPDGEELAFYATGTGGEKFYIVNVEHGEITFTADREIDLQAPGSPIREWGVMFTEGKDCFDNYLGVSYP